MVVLARELERRGHATVLGVPPNLVGFAARAGLDALPFGPDTQAFMESPDGQGWLASGDVRTFMKALTTVVKAHLAQTKAELLDVVQGTDLVVAGLLAEDLALPAAEAADVPLLTLHSAPMRRTGVVAAPAVTARALPRPLNRASGALFERVWWRGFKDDVAALRAELALPVNSRTTPAIRTSRPRQCGLA